jgi:hypothetical protein
MFLPAVLVTFWQLASLPSGSAISPLRIFSSEDLSVLLEAGYSPRVFLLG